jgi:hypothetical protein
MRTERWFRLNHAASRHLPTPAAIPRRTPWRFKSSHPHSQIERVRDHLAHVANEWRIAYGPRPDESSSA